MAVLFGGLAPRSTVTDAGGNATLEGARDVEAVNVGGNSFVYVTGLFGDGLSSFQLGSDGSLNSIGNINDNDTLELAGAVSFTSVAIGGSTYLYANGYDDDGLSAFRVEANGALTNIQNIQDTSGSTGLQLNGTRGQLTTATAGGNNFVVATGYLDDGVSVFRVNGDGTLGNTANVDKTAVAALNQPRDATSAVVDGRSFIFVAGYGADAVSVFELDAAGGLTFRSSVTDASNGALNLDGAYGVTTATVAGAAYLVVSGEEDDGLSVFQVDGSGQLQNVFNVEDSGERGLDAPRGLTTFTLQGETFVAVSAATDAALSVFHLGAGGRLSDVSAFFDTDATALRGSRYNTFTEVGGVPLLLATGQSDKGVSTFELGGDADRIKGGSEGDLVLGLAGNDNLQGGGGKDTLLGGLGNDKLQGGAARDVLEGGKGNDDFIFKSVRESGPSGGKRDRIEDFRGRDDIVLRKIDADKTEKGNQKFDLDAGGGFDAGEIRVKDTKAGVVLEMNIDADARAEMSLLLSDFNGKINDADFLF